MKLPDFQSRAARRAQPTHWDPRLSLWRSPRIGRRARALSCCFAPGILSIGTSAREGVPVWDQIGPLKLDLGEPFRHLERRLHALAGERYGWPGMPARV